jgi:hypothetical protein
VFKAEVHFGEKRRPLQGDYRPLLRFADDTLVGFTWPDFESDDGKPIPSGCELPIDVSATLYAYSEDVMDVLRAHAKVGAAIWLTEGRKTVATGTIVALCDGLKKTG